MKYAYDALEYLRSHPELTQLLIWPVLTAVITGLFGPRSSEEWEALKAKSKWRYEVAQFLSAWGIDTPQFINFLKRVTSRGK